MPNFRNLLVNILTQWAVVFGQIFEIWTNKFLKQFVSNVPLFILEYSDSVGELGCSWKRVKWGGTGGLRGPQRLTQSDWEIRFEPGCYGFGPGCRSAWDFGGIWCGGEEEHTAGDNESLSIELFWWLEFGRWLGNWGAGGDWVDKASIGLGSSGELEKNVKFTFEVTWPSREGLPLPRGFLVFGSSWIKDGLIFKVREIWRYNEMFDFTFYFLCWGYVWGGQYVRFGWHLWLESLKMCFFILLCIFRFTGKSRASRCGTDRHVSGGGHLWRQFRWESWWCKNSGSVQLLYSVISVHVFAILVYNEDREWGKVVSWWFSIVLVLCFLFKMIRFRNFFRGQLWVQIEEIVWVWTFCYNIVYFVWWDLNFERLY